MRVLLTNDDGVDAAGLRSLRERLIELCESVVTVAPDRDCSGFARKCTYSRPVHVVRLSGGQHPIYSCDGTPADCVRIGLLSDLGADPDLVVSGINHGANLADDVTYSGTIGAGLEAAILGSSGLCLSQQSPTGSFSVNQRRDRSGRGPAYDFSETSAHAAELAVAMMRARSPEPVVLSVNYPTRLSDLRPLVTRPGRRAYPKVSAEPWSDGPDERSVYLFGEPDEVIPEAGDTEGTDIAALREGRVSLTPLSLGLGASPLSEAAGAYLGRLGAQLLAPGPIAGTP